MQVSIIAEAPYPYNEWFDHWIKKRGFIWVAYKGREVRKNFAVLDRIIIAAIEFLLFLLFELERIKERHRSIYVFEIFLYAIDDETNSVTFF